MPSLLSDRAPAETRAHHRPALVRSPTTRILHLVLLLAVLHQLAGSQLMERPFPGDTPEPLYLLHTYIGLGSLGLILAFWVWAVVRRGETRLGRLIPWFSPTRLGEVVADATDVLRRLARFRFPDDTGEALASAVHGLGLLAVSAMAVTGGVYFVLHGTAAAHIALGVHKLLANAVWAYLVVHAGMALLHQLLGSDMLGRMFWGSRDDGAQP